MKRFIKLSVFLLLAILLPTFADASQVIEAKRLSGESRVHTSIEISKQAYTSAKNVVLVGYDGEVDALTGSLLATNKQAPIIFVSYKYLADVQRLLVELNTQNVYILGGESVFSKNLFNEFKAYNPKRIQGASRYETAVNIAKESIGETASEVFLALGTGNYADALAIGSVAAKNQKPLLLAANGALSRETRNALISMKVKKVSIIGGNTAIPETIANELKALNINVSRISGDSREETAIAVARAFNPNHSSIVVANGWKYADAVVGGYFVAKENAVLLLAKTDKLSVPLLDYFIEKQVKTFVLGGSSVVSPSTLDNISKNLNLKIDLAQVSNEAQLINALANPKIKTININANIQLKDEVFIKRPITIEGNNKIISGARNSWYKEDTWYNAITVSANNVIISNLTIQKADSNNLYFEDVIGGQLNNLTLKDAGVGGLYVNSAEVKVNNIKTLNNYWQGIGVSKDFDRDPKLTVTNSHVHSSYKEYEKDFTPAIAIFDRLINDGWVNAAGYIEEKLQGDETHFGILQYCFYDPKEYPSHSK